MRESFRSRPACDSLLLLATLDHYELCLDRVCKLFVARRTAAPFATPSEIVTCFDAIETLLLPIKRAEYSLLVDVRRGPSRNDPAFEETIVQYRGKLLVGFGKNVALTATTVGGLQVHRYAKADGRDVFVTQSAADACQHLGIGVHPL